MTLNLSLPPEKSLKPKIFVIGVGGAGGNAVNNMISANLEGVRFIVANTDAQTLENSSAETRIQLGENITKGLGAGAKPNVGKAAAEESIDEIIEQLSDAHMVFITAGMGGGTGTGASPVIAKAARERHILTVGVVTKPFHFEGRHRMNLAEEGIRELQQYVDTLIIIPNQNLFRIANEKTTFADAFKMADEVLYSGVRGITDLMIMPGLINLDFADIKTVMSEMGSAMMGTGEASGDNRAIAAAEMAISNPLLDDVSLKGARGVLINITGGNDITLFEADEAANCIREQIDENANIIFGSTFDENLNGKIRVSIVATGINGGNPNIKQPIPSIQSISHDIRPTLSGMPQSEHAPTASLNATALDIQEGANMEELFSSVRRRLDEAQKIMPQQDAKQDYQKEATENHKYTPTPETSSAIETTESYTTHTDDVFIPSQTTSLLQDNPYTSLEHPLGVNHDYPQETHEQNFFMSHDYNSKPNKGEPSSSLFKKVSGLMNKKQEEKSTPPLQQGDLFAEQSLHAETVKQEEKVTSTTKDLLDIPAFLRRQAN